jgi:hypothetical protein
MRLALRATLACAVVGTLAIGTTASPAAPAPRQAIANALTAATATSTTAAADPTATERLHTAADGYRHASGLETLYGRTGYLATARSIATSLVETQPITGPADSAPIAYLGGITAPDIYDAVITSAIDSVVQSANAVLAYRLHTDGGWAVVTKTLPGGSIRYGIALVVGWPAPFVPTTTGCANSSGYCWSTGGLNPHLSWTRNVVRWYLSTANLPANGQSLVKTAIANVNAVSGFGASLVYGGLTTDTTPTAAHRFVVVWGSGCTTAGSLACTVAGTQGTDRFVYQARTVVTASRYAANPNTAWWVGTLMHEIGHAVGLAHFDGTYAGGYQLMRWAGGPNTIRPGDANGLRRIAPPGAVTASLRGVARGGGYDVVVRAANSGLGGVRSVRADCLGTDGAWHAVGAVSGWFDGRSVDRTLATVGAGSTCRAVVRSGDRVAVSTSVRLG